MNQLTDPKAPVTDEELDQMIWKLERNGGMTPKLLSLMRELREVRRAKRGEQQNQQQNIQENIPTLRDGLAVIRNSGVAIDVEKILAERDALNAPAAPDGWIPVSERMPETMVSVLVTGDWFHHDIAFWDGGSWCDLDFEAPVTHWQPLPSAPKQM